jgi:hypothetical protein
MRDRNSYWARWAVVAAVVASVPTACNSPTSPDHRTGFVAMRISCLGSAPLLACVAYKYCGGPYPCPNLPTDPYDVTRLATWTSRDSTVVRFVDRPGVFEAVSPGNTQVAADHDRVTGTKTVAVFEETGALPTSEIWGTVRESGTTGQAGLITGAVVQMLNGHIAGRTSVSGVPPPLIPGFSGPIGGAGTYRFIGVPPGTYTLRASVAGYGTTEQSVTTQGEGSPMVNFDLTRSDLFR